MKVKTDITWQISEAFLVPTRNRAIALNVIKTFWEGRNRLSPDIMDRAVLYETEVCGDGIRVKASETMLIHLVIDAPTNNPRTALSYAKNRVRQHPMPKDPRCNTSVHYQVLK